MAVANKMKEHDSYIYIATSIILHPPITSFLFNYNIV